MSFLYNYIMGFCTNSKINFLGRRVLLRADWSPLIFFFFFSAFSRDAVWRLGNFNERLVRCAIRSPLEKNILWTYIYGEGSRYVFVDRSSWNRVQLEGPQPQLRTPWTWTLKWRVDLVGVLHHLVRSINSLFTLLTSVSINIADLFLQASSSSESESV